MAYQAEIMADHEGHGVQTTLVKGFQVSYSRSEKTLRVTDHNTYEKVGLPKIVTLTMKNIMKFSEYGWLTPTDQDWLISLPFDRESQALSLCMLEECEGISITEPRETGTENEEAKSMVRIHCKEEGKSVKFIDIAEIRGIWPKLNSIRLYEKACNFLHEKACNRIGDMDFQNAENLVIWRDMGLVPYNMLRAKYFYRNKTPEYFHDIEKNFHGIMRPYIKDENGDPNSPINGEMEGLFFCCNVWGESNLPNKSPFGSRRFVAPVKALLENLGPFNIYFADFYCMVGTSRIHYVTLVLCEKDEDADKFCKSRLQLLPQNNPFFRLTSDGSEFFVIDSYYAWVELFYTKSIDINDMITNKGAEITDVEELESKKFTNSQGIPKTPNCPSCNAMARETWPSNRYRDAGK